MKNSFLIVLAALLIALTGCSSDSGNGDGGSSDTDQITDGDTTTPDETPDMTPDETPDTTPDETPDMTPDETPDMSPDETPDMTPDETPDTTPDETPDTTPDETPDTTPDETPDTTPDETPDTTPDADAVTTSGCEAILNCMNDCKDDACAKACYDNGTTTGQTDYDALTKCYQDNNCAGKDLTCIYDNCKTEGEKCNFTIPALYGTAQANANILFILDYTKINDEDYITAHQNALINSAIFTGTYGNGKPFTPQGENVMAYSARVALQGKTPHIVVAQFNETSNPGIQMFFPSDNITAGKLLIPNNAYFFLINDLGNNTDCVLAISYFGEINVTKATNTTAVDGGALAFTIANTNIYHTTDTPEGDISADMGGVCPKE